MPPKAYCFAYQLRTNVVILKALKNASNLHFCFNS